MESLNKNDKVKEYVITIIVDRIENNESKSVLAVLEVLKEKYSKSKIEKCNEIMDKILNFSAKAEESCEKYWDKFESLMSDLKR